MHYGYNVDTNLQSVQYINAEIKLGSNLFVIFLCTDWKLLTSVDYVFLYTYCVLQGYNNECYWIYGTILAIFNDAKLL